MTKNDPLLMWYRAFGVIIILFLAFAQSVYSQCAGEDNSITICDKFDDVSNRTFDLFSNLNGTPTPGGIWSTSNSANLSAIDVNSGIVDLWKINFFGQHQFTYTNDDCGESATVTVTLGGYAGQDNIDGSANSCSDNSAVNLFAYLGSQIDDEVPDFNGVWEEDPMTQTGFLNGNLFNAVLAGPGEYIFTYTVPDVDICSGQQSTVFLEIHPAPDSGNPIDFVACTTDDLSAYTNFDLHSLLAGEDANGTWSEGFTNQISDPNDNIINIEEINDNFGYGTYTFFYTVYPTHPVCSYSTTEISVIILPVLNGNMEVSNYCVETDYEVTINYDASLLPSGKYDMVYRINSTEGMEDIITSIDLDNGTGIFNISPSAVPINEIVQLNIIGIQGTIPEQNVCPSIEVPQVEFLVSNPTASGQNICPDNDVTIQLDNILNSDGNLANENHTIDYTLNLPNNSIINLVAQNIEFTDGSASFVIPSSNFGLEGGYVAEISVENSFEIDCAITANFEVTPIPDDIELGVVVDNSCDATAVDVIIDAPPLSNGNYEIDYKVIEEISETTLINNSINFTGGSAKYEIDITNLPDGDYVVVLKSTQNDTTPCRLQFEFALQENFTIGGTPEIVEAAAEQSFCLNNGIPTLEDISVNASGDISFFENDTTDEVLPITTPLVDGEDYFITSTDPNNNCVSQERVRIQVSLLTASPPTTNSAVPILCGSENPTLLDLNVSSTNGGNIVWYSSASNGTSIDSDEILVDGQSYFAAEQLNGFCESETRLEVTPTIINTPLPDLKTNDLSLCSLDNPNVADLENLENVIDAEVEWFDVEQGGTALSSMELLMDDTTYYAQSYDVDTGCINKNRVPVTVDLNNCDPEKYGFFIPDAFSPNSDGRNDTYYIPNIEIIFPDFTLEIFNRYGNSLFKGDASNPAWDGKGPGGKTAPNGVYFYLINFNRDGIKPKQGRLYLNR